jgi:hypothetical protein
MLTNFVLSPTVDFLLTWQRKSDCHVSKSALPRQQKVDFFLATLTKSQQNGVNQNSSTL